MTADERHVKWNDVEWRVDGNIDGGGGARVVPYLDAPTVARYLDQWVGPFNWRDSYEPVKQGVLWCHIEARDPETGEWVRKTDLGTASNFEADKGVVSDAFKRCAMRKWRVGGNVFDLPTIRLQRGQFDTYESKGKTHAKLTKKSLEAIVRQLHAQGYTDAAAAARVNTDGDDARAERADDSGVVTGEASGGSKPSASTPTPAQAPSETPPASSETPPASNEPKSAPSGANGQPGRPITDGQVKAVHTLWSRNGDGADEAYRGLLFHQYGVRSSKELSSLQAGDFISLLNDAARLSAALREVAAMAGDA